METSIEDRWITDPASVTDPEAADVLRSLDRARPDHETWSPEGLRRFGGEVEVGCRTTRRVVRPLPGVTQDERDPDTAEIRRLAAEHLEQCGDCGHWVSAGKPYRLDLENHDDRAWLCGRVRSLIQAPAGPQSETAAREHAVRCGDCAEWLQGWEARANCEAPRERLRRRSGELSEHHEPVDYTWTLAYSFDEPDTFLYDHLSECEGCREWCLTAAACSHVRERINHVISCNSAEWKVYSHETLNPLEACHLHLCVDCRKHLLENFERDVNSDPVFTIIEEMHIAKRSRKAAAAFYSRLAAALHEAFSAPPAPVEPRGPDPRGKDTPIRDVDFSVRTYNCLNKAGVETIGQLAEKSQDELMAIRNFTGKSIPEIDLILSTYGLALRQEGA